MLVQRRFQVECSWATLVDRSKANASGCVWRKIVQLDLTWLQGCPILGGRLVCWLVSGRIGLVVFLSATSPESKTFSWLWQQFGICKDKCCWSTSINPAATFRIQSHFHSFTWIQCSMYRTEPNLTNMTFLCVMNVMKVMKDIKDMKVMKVMKVM